MDDEEDAAENAFDADVWRLRPLPRRPLDPPGMSGRPDPKTFEAELHKQALHCHDKIQKDLDLARTQMLNQVHEAVTQELAEAAAFMVSLKNDANAEIKGVLDTVTAWREQDAAAVQAWRQEDAAAAQGLAESKAKCLSEQNSMALASAVASLRLETNAAVASLRQEAAVLEQLLRDQLEQLEKARLVQSEELEQSLKKQLETSLQSHLPADLTALAGERKADDGEAALSARIAELQEVVRAQGDASKVEMERFAEAARSAEAASEALISAQLAELRREAVRHGAASKVESAHHAEDSQTVDAAFLAELADLQEAVRAQGEFQKVLSQELYGQDQGVEALASAAPEGQAKRLTDKTRVAQRELLASQHAELQELLRRQNAASEAAQSREAAFSAQLSELRQAVRAQGAAAAEGESVLSAQLAQLQQAVRAQGAASEAATDGPSAAMVQTAQAALSARLVDIQESLLAQGAASEARFQEQASQVAKDLELAERRLAVRCEALEAGAKEPRPATTDFEGKIVDVAQMIERVAGAYTEVARLNNECREELAYAHSTWARIINWSAQVDLARLERDGLLDLASPSFDAAGLRALQLHLRLRPRSVRGAGEAPGRARWTVGAFLQAAAGQVSFRLQVGGKSLAFDTDFSACASECGSGSLAVLESTPDTILVRLEILHVVAPIGDLYPPGLAVSMKSSDGMQAAVREAMRHKSLMVRRIEWHVTRVSERLHAARTAAVYLGREESLEPVVSPAFSAAGFEGLQLYLYPLGYKNQPAEMCGFFLRCPKGMHAKFKAFIGDAVQNVDHVYEYDRELLGRNNFCRLADAADSSTDTVVCGVELQEAWLEQHGPQARYASDSGIWEQVKLVSHPQQGSIMVLELKESSDLSSPSGGKARVVRKGKQGRGALGGAAAQQQQVLQIPHDRAAKAAKHSAQQVPPRMAISKSLPSLPTPPKGDVTPTKDIEIEVSPRRAAWR